MIIIIFFREYYIRTNYSAFYIDVCRRKIHVVRRRIRRLFRDKSSLHTSSHLKVIMAKVTEISEYLRKQIIQLHSEGIPYWKISAQVNVPPLSVQLFVSLRKMAQRTISKTPMLTKKHLVSYLDFAKEHLRKETNIRKLSFALMKPEFELFGRNAARRVWRTKETACGRKKKDTYF